MLSTAKPTPLRLAGFLSTAAGGLLIGIGSVATWATVTIGVAGASSSPAGAPPGGIVSGLPSVPTKGTDTIEGKIALACALLILVAIPVMRIARRRIAPAIALLVVLAGLVAGGLAMRDVLASDTRLGAAGNAKIAHLISSQTHLPYADLLRIAQHHPAAVDVKPWIYAVVLGAGAAVAGGILSFVWAKSQRLPTDNAPVVAEGDPGLST